MGILFFLPTSQSEGWIVGVCESVSELPIPYITSNHKIGFIFGGEGEKGKKAS